MMMELARNSLVNIELTSGSPLSSPLPAKTDSTTTLGTFNSDVNSDPRPWTTDSGFLFEYPASPAATTAATTYHQQQHQANAVEPGPPRKRAWSLNPKAVVIDLTIEEEDEKNSEEQQKSPRGDVQIIMSDIPPARQVTSSSSTALPTTLRRTSITSSSSDDEITITAECSACLDQKPLSTLLRLPCTTHYLCHENAAPGSCLELSIKASLSTRTLFTCCTRPLPASLLTLPPSPSNFFPTPLLPLDPTTAYTLLHEELTTDSPLFCNNTFCRTFIPSSSIPPRGRALASCPKCGKQTCQFCRRRPGRGHNWTECRNGALGRVSRKGKVKCTLGKRKREEGEVMEELDEGMKKLMEAKGWKRCPWWDKGCGALVEKKNGCDHVRCRCGKEMCYRCGKKYHECRGKCAKEPSGNLPGVAEVMENARAAWPQGNADTVAPPVGVSTAFVPPASTDPLNTVAGEHFWGSPENQRFVNEFLGIPTTQQIPALPASTAGLGDQYLDAFVGFEQDQFWGRTLDPGGNPFDAGEMAFFDFAVFGQQQQQVWGA